jgi:hypothetical protein
MLCLLSFARLLRQQMVDNVNWIAVDQFLSPAPLHDHVAALFHSRSHL